MTGPDRVRSRFPMSIEPDKRPCMVVPPFRLCMKFTFEPVLLEEALLLGNIGRPRVERCRRLHDIERRQFSSAAQSGTASGASARRPRAAYARPPVAKRRRGDRQHLFYLRSCAFPLCLVVESWSRLTSAPKFDRPPAQQPFFKGVHGAGDDDGHEHQHEQRGEEVGGVEVAIETASRPPSPAIPTSISAPTTPRNV